MPAADYEIRDADTPKTSGTLIRGYAAVFNSPALIAGEFIEQIAPGAFTETLKKRDVLALIAHDWGRVLGRVSAGTLRLKEDPLGLAFELDVDLSTPSGQEIFGNVKQRNVRQCSFGFSVLRSSWDDSGDLPVRTLQEISLGEISILANPAYEDTTAWVSSRANNAAAAARRRAEAKMRARGML